MGTAAHRPRLPKARTTRAKSPSAKKGSAHLTKGPPRVKAVDGIFLRPIKLHGGYRALDLSHPVRNLIRGKSFTRGMVQFSLSGAMDRGAFRPASTPGEALQGDYVTVVRDGVRSYERYTLREFESGNSKKSHAVVSFGGVHPTTTDR